MNDKLKKVKPLGHHILVKTIDEEVKTESGLLMSAEDIKKLRYKAAKVVKPGTEVSVVKEGDSINYDKHAGYTMYIGGESFTMIKQGDISIVI
jgi:co-chaperonin GroES (HSP10)